MKVSATRHDPLSFRSLGEEPPLGLTCRQIFSLGSTMEALEPQKDKQHLYWPRLGPDFTIGAFPPDDHLSRDLCRSSEDLLRATPADVVYNKLHPPQQVVLHGNTALHDAVSDPSLDSSTAHTGLGVHVLYSSSGEHNPQPQSNILTPECHCERHAAEEASEVPASPRVKLLCSFGGKIMPRPIDGKLRYVGGETRIITVSRHISFAEFMSKMAQFYGAPLGLKYQLPDEDLEALVSVSSDDDLQNMMEEYDKVESGNSSVSWLRLFFFSSPIEGEVSDQTVEGEDGFSVADNQRYVDAINGVTEKLQGGLLEEVVPGFHQVGASNTFDQVNEVNETLSKGPSAPSSSPSSPSLASRNVSYQKSPGLVDVSLPNLNEHLSKVQVFEEDRDKDGSGSSSSTPYHHQIDYQHHDEQIFLAADSPRIVHHDLPVSRGENWAGLRHVDSQAKVVWQPESHVVPRTNGGVSLEHWHDMQPPVHDIQVSTHDTILPLGEQQRTIQQHKQSFFQQQHQHQQLPGLQQNWHLPIDGDSMRVMHQDIHKQPQVALQPPHQHFPHHNVSAHDTWRNEHHLATTPFVHGLNPANPQIKHGLTPAPPYQVGSAPTAPRVAVYDHQGKCSCGLQHSQVHRGVTVSIGDPSYSRWPPHSSDQACRNQNFRNSSRFCGNTSHDMALWQQGDPMSVAEAEHRDYGATPRQHYHGMHSRECQLEARSRGLLYSDPVLHHGEYLSSTHDRLDVNKRCSCMRCVDARRQLSETSAFSEAPDQATEWVMHRKGFDLDGGRVSTPRKAFPRAPLYKEEDHLDGFPNENSTEAELGLAVSHITGDFDGRIALASRAVALPYSRKPPMPAASQLTKPSLPEELVSQPSGHAASDWQSRAALDSWSMTSLEPGLCVDKLPLQHGQTTKRLEEECRISLDSRVSNSNLVNGSLAMVERLPNTEVQGDNYNELRYHPLWREDNGIPAVVGRVTGEVAMPGVQFADGGLNTGVKVPTAHGDSYISIPDVIPLDSAATSASLHFQAGVSAANPVTGIIGQNKASTSPIYDQSPLSSMKTADFSFAPGDPPSEAKNDKECLASHLPVSELLAGGMTSSMVECSSNEESTNEYTDANVKVAAHSEFVKVLKEQSVATGTDTDKKPTSIGSNTSTPFVAELGKGLLELHATPVNDMLGRNKGTVDMAQIIQSCATNKTSYQEKDSEIGNVSIDESKEAVLLQAEAEARARGLQIIKNADLEDLKELGSGTYGTVYHGKWRGSDVAIKRIKASCFNGSPSERNRLITDFWKEACTLGQLHHPNVVAFYGVVPDGPGGTLATVTEYMVNGSLKQVLQKKDRTIDRRKRLFIAMDAAFGMEYLHSKNVVHFDLKCENLLVNMRDAHRPICKVGDFGLSKVKHQTLVSGGVRGTLPWMAPELLNGSSRMVTEKVDVFSFGIVMWELLTGEEPYANMHCGAIINGIVNDTLRPTIPSWCDPGWRNLMERCWSANPSDRPAFAEVVSELRGIAASMKLK